MPARPTAEPSLISVVVIEVVADGIINEILVHRMVTQLLSQPSLDNLLRATANLVKLPTRKMWFDYDARTDVVYRHFTEQSTSTHSEMSDEGIILDYHEDELVGLTILDASQR